MRELLFHIQPRPELDFGRSIPEISRFFGIAITLSYQPAGPPHFHALTAHHHVTVRIEDGAVSGPFPPRALGLVLEWREKHGEELRENWERARLDRPFYPIAPLE